MGSTDETTVNQIAAEAVNDAFRGRKGHGGGPCTRRVLRPSELKAILKSVIEKAIERKEFLEGAKAVGAAYVAAHASEPDNYVGINRIVDKHGEDCRMAVIEAYALGKSQPAHASEQETPEYQQFLAECAKHCRCSMTICESVLAGAPCEERIEPNDLDDNLP